MILILIASYNSLDVDVKRVEDESVRRRKKPNKFEGKKV
jgi:hypothetical protein